MSPQVEPAAPRATPDPGRDDSTRDRILQLLLSSGQLTSVEIADRLQLAAAGIRRHLINLSEEGQVETVEPSGPRGRGRPAKLYQLTPAGRRGFGEAYHDLALSALAELVEVVGPDAVGRLAEKRLGEVEEDYRRRRAAEPDTDSVKHLADALSAAGYFASSEADGELSMHHCPVAHVAARYPQLCEAESHVFARLLGTDVSQSATIASGDVACRAHLGGPTMLPDPIPANTDRSADRKVIA